jgi:hypothetical protein
MAAREAEQSTLAGLRAASALRAIPGVSIANLTGDKLAEDHYSNQSQSFHCVFILIM